MKAAIAIILGLVTGPVAADCPSQETLRARLAEIDLTRAARTARFKQAVPTELHDKALNNIGKPFSVRDGQRVSGVIVAPVAADKIWRAINDEEHHALGYLPVDFSAVVEGRPRGKDRVLFQYYRRAGIGRWWASHVFINSRIHETTKGKIWEVYWHDWMDEVDREQPPISDVAGEIHPIEASEGSWMLVPLAESCTLVEQYSSSDPGGALGVVQALVAASAIRDTLKGIVEMAREHHCEPPAAEDFLGPDGQPVSRSSSCDARVSDPVSPSPGG
jgi:hypothetical protein